jgi:hypothetical protein
MPSIHAKPQIPTATLAKSLDQLQKAIDKSTKADGSVDVKKLETALKTADPGAKLGLAAIADAFVRERTYYSGGGCGSSSSSHTVQEKPTSLDKSEVKSVLSALLAARSKVESFDTKKADGKAGKDGKLSPEEAAAASKLAGKGLGADIALATLQGAENATTEGAKLGPQLARVFGRAEAAVMATKGRDGTITMSTLEAAMDRLPAGIDSKAMFAAISSAYERARTVYSGGGGGCGGGGGSSRTVYDAPSKLTKKEAGEVMSAFAQAVQLVVNAGTLGGAATMKQLISDAKSAGSLVGELMELAVKPHLPRDPPPVSYSRSGC